MAEKIVLAELDIDVEALLKNTSDIKKEIDFLKKAQSDLKKAGDTSSKTFVQNASDLKVLSQAYNQNVKALAANTKAVSDLAAREDLLNQVLQQEVTSIEEAREQNKLLNKLRNTATTTLGEQSEEVQKLNEKLNQNNEFIKANADNYLKQKINIGNYSESIKEAFQDINIFNGGLAGFAVRSKEAGGAGILFTKSLKSMTSGMLGLIKASLSFLATPIGIVIGSIGAAFLLVKNAMNKSEESTNKISKAFSGLAGIFKLVLKALKPLGDFLIGGFVKTLEIVEAAIDSVVSAFAWILDFLGFDETAESLRGMNKEVREASRLAQELAEKEQELEKAQRKSRLTQLQYQKDAEKLRQIRDNDILSIKERITANEELGKVLEEQLKEELKIAQTALEVANLRIKAEGQTKEALDAQADALTEIADIEERITGQKSEQLTNRNALEKEAADKEIAIREKAEEAKQKAIDVGIKKLEQELELYKAQQGVRAKTLSDEIEQEKNFAERELQILKEKLKNERITQTEFDTESLNLKRSLLEKEIELIDQNAERELQIFLDKNQRKIDSEQFFTEQLLELENQRIQRVEEFEKNAAQKRLESGAINEQEYQDEITRIQNEAQTARDEATVLREEAIKEQKAVDIANQKELDLLNFETELERKKFELEEKRLAEVEAAEKVNGDVSLINKRYAILEKQLDKSVADQKSQVNREAVGDIAGALGEESSLGKSAALVQAGINVQQGITKALALGGFAGIAKGVAVAASGAKAISSITGANVKFKDGGVFEVGGKRHASGGTKFFGEDGSAFEAEQGEYIGILSRNAVSGFESLNNELGNAATLANLQQTSNVSQFVTNNNTLGVNEIEAIVSQTMKSMPPIYTSVTDINEGQMNYAQVVDGANLG